MNAQKHRQSMAAGLAAVALLVTAACSAPSGSTDTAEAVATANAVTLDSASLDPGTIVGQGKYGEKPATAADLKLSDADMAKVRAGNFTAGIVMQTATNDWSALTVKGIKDTLAGLGVKVIGVTDGKFDVQKQISDIENMITQKPDLIISIPVDDVATAEAYKKVAAAGIKLIMIMMPPAGLKYPTDYQAVVGPDDQGNGQIAAQALAEYIPKNGTAGIVDFGVDFFTTNQRSLRVKEWFAEKRPDVTIKTVTFTDPGAVGQIASNFVTANPGLNGLFVSWDLPAMQTIAALRTANVDLPVTTIDLGTEVAVDMAAGGYVKAIGAEMPYDQGVAEALAGAQALIGNPTPAWVSLPAVPVTPSNLLEVYPQVFKTDPPAELLAACAASKICG